MSSHPVLHAQPMIDPSAGMRWVLPEESLPVGRLLDTPGMLGQMIADGVVDEAWCEPHALRLRLHQGLSWRDHGERVRLAIMEALENKGDWRTDGDRDSVLRAIVVDILAGPVGDYITSHGGVIEIREIKHDEVTLDFGGACAHCSSSGATLHDRLETAVRERYPVLKAIGAAGDCGDRVKLVLWPRRTS